MKTVSIEDMRFEFAGVREALEGGIYGKMPLGFIRNHPAYTKVSMKLDF